MLDAPDRVDPVTAPVGPDAADAVAADGGAAPQDGATAPAGPLDRWAQRACLVVTLAPLVVAAVALVVGVGGDYLPASDHALTELQVRDVGRHEVFVGLYSRADWSHPGPALFYLLAPFYRLAGGASIGMNLGALALNGGALAGMLLVARRHGGTPLMVTTALACALLMRSLGAEFLHDPWNCFVTTLPFGLAIMLAWSMASGWRWALPLGVGVASALAQAHVGFVALALPAAAAGAVALGVRSVRAARGGGARGPVAVARGSGLVAPVLVTLGALAVMWAPPLLDAVRYTPSNAAKVVNWFREGEGGAHTPAQGVRTIAGQFGLDAEWLGGKAPPSLGGESPFLYAAPLPWLLVPVAVAAVVLWRRGGPGRRLAVTLAGVVLLSVAAVARTVGPAFDYRLRWTWTVAALVAAAAAWAGVRALAERTPRHRNAVLGALLAGLVVVSAVNVVTGATAGTPQRGDSAAVAAVMPAVLEEVAGVEGQVVVTDAFATGAWYARSIVLQLERHGVDARVPPDQEQLFGRRRVVDGEPEVTLVVAMNEFVETLEENPALRPVGEWSSASPDELASAARERRRLDEDVAAGRIGTGEGILRVLAIDSALVGDTGATFYRVGVFARTGETP